MAVARVAGSLRTSEVHLESKDLCVGSWNNAFFVLWRANPSLDSVPPLEAQYRAMALRCTEPFVPWVIVEKKVTPPDERTRQALTRAMDSVSSSISASVAVLEATGFLAATARGALTAMSMVMRSSYPRKFFGTVGEAAQWSSRWITDGKGQPVSPERLASQVNEFRDLVAKT